ncbi:hypothetical protein [Hymenobacter sp. B81]|uniref:hypothetical protein n=1 Tax=Hymenobacter sp. B81 TaxID=3344878 RepID=UPI0037DCB72D
MSTTLEELDGYGARIAALERLCAKLQRDIDAIRQDADQWVDTEKALQILGISRSTLLVQRSKTPQRGKVLYRKDGKKCLYSRESCKDYSQRQALASNSSLRIAS